MECAAILDAANPARQLAERPREEPGVCAAAQIAHQGVRLPRTCSGAKQLHVLQQPPTNPMLTCCTTSQSASGVCMQHGQLTALPEDTQLRLPLCNCAASRT